MTPHDLLLAFDTLAEAPEGVTRLRELVVQLAVRGQLVPQDPDETPPFRPVASENVDSVKFRTGRPWAGTEPTPQQEAPFDLPRGWVWVRVNDTGTYTNGLAFKPSQWKTTGRPIIRIQNLTDETNEFHYTDGDFSDDVIVRDGDLLVSWSATLEAFIWHRGEGVLNQHIFRVEPCDSLVDRTFLYWLLRQAIRDIANSEHAHGLAMKHVNRGPFLAHVVGIPPLAEQHRIVARVDELMGLLDRFEAARSTRDGTRTALRDSALAALRDADTFEEVEVAWHRIAERMADIVTDPDDVDPLRQAVLGLAVRGRLVPQDPADEPANVLLGRIAAHKARLVKEGKIRKFDLLPRVSKEEVPFEAPARWSLCRLAEVSLKVTDGEHKTPRRSSEGYYLLSARNVLNGRIDLTDVDYVPEDEFSRIRRRCDPDSGDVLISCSGSVGRVAVVDRDGAYAMVRSAALVKPSQEHVDSRFLALCLRSPLVQHQIAVRSRQSAQANLFIGQIASLACPLPPLAEQHRIVARVDDLMSLLDRLEQHLVAKRDTHDTFAAAAVHHLDG
jgi:type I restriction enzyme S subunit